MNDWTIEGHICSKHARKRMQQRGIKKETVEFVLRHGDRQEYVGRDTSSVYLSKKMIGRLSHSKMIKASAIEKASKIIVLIAEEIIVTAFPRRIGQPRRHQRAEA